jgi:flagellar biogenesis protein FliO
MAHGPDPAPALGSELYGLLQAALALVVVALLAVVCLRWLARRGWGRNRGTLVEVEERVALDARNSLMVVRVEGRRLLLATHHAGPARLVTELGAAPRALEPVAPKSVQP